MADAEAPATPKMTSGKNPNAKVIVVLEKCSLETVKTKRGYELLCADSHHKILKKIGKTPSDFRPDICHRALLYLNDSPLNKSGNLQVYLHTEKVSMTSFHHVAFFLFDLDFGPIS